MTEGESLKAEGESSDLSAMNVDTNRSYHLFVLQPGTLGENVRVKLITSPFNHESGLDAGTEIVLSRLRYEKVRLDPPCTDIKNDPDLAKYRIPDKMLRGMRSYNPIPLREFKEEPIYELE